ncbi:TetR/AcrR family transcriptional regulator [Bordetella genomosp. 4]|uniref:TetR/AcrR family transcriptional regulator n=1 Tax=Bordetella genomosp. 4 TaxID=463044 RepID=UPI000B9E10FF|nr:TetR family transcriptional regulator [Bordetella genomosp. 4]OZI48484.1 TetR family transcriptional regulator [Bordetella genomosp. 4]
MTRKTASSAAAELSPQSASPKLASERIRETARRMFYEDGIRAVGVDALVAEAGVTKPSLYRSFSSKDELAASYLRDYEGEFWAKFNEGAALYPDDPRAALMVYFERLAQRSAGRRAQPESDRVVADEAFMPPATTRYRGCGLTNAVVEYPEPDHPAHQVAVTHKAALRARMVELATAMGAAEPEILADGLVLLLEGAFVSGQIFGEGGPARYLPEIASRLIDASMAPGEPAAPLKR